MEDTERVEVEETEVEEADESSTDVLGFDPVALVEAAVSGRTSGMKYDDDDVVVSRPRDMPKIDHLRDAIEMTHAGDPLFLLPVGSRLIIERRSGLLHGRPWIDTKVYEIREIDQDSGLLKLWDPETHHHARDNFKAGVRVGSRYKVPPLKGRWDAPPKVVKVPVNVQVSPVEMGIDGMPVKRGRGRPAGVKNRSKEVIEQEKAIRAAMKLGKKGRK